MRWATVLVAVLATSGCLGFGSKSTPTTHSAPGATETTPTSTLSLHPEPQPTPTATGTASSTGTTQSSSSPTAPASAPQGVGVLRGRIVDGEGKAAWMARVEAQSGQATYAAWANRSGVYELHLPFAAYRITAHSPCHSDASAGFTFAANQTLHLVSPTAPPAAPSVPQAVTATTGPGPDQVTVSWQPPQSEGSGPVVGYNVYHGTPGQEALRIKLPNVLAFADHGRTVLDAQSYRIAAVNACGQEGPQSPSLATQGALPVNSLPLSTSASAASNVEVSETTFPVLDATGQPVGTKAWRIITGTGNCCENHLASTPDGRLWNMGGTDIYTSSDNGETWMRTPPAAPHVNSEGTLAVAPGGDVVGVSFDPYSGDRVYAIKYVAATNSWLSSEVPLHKPFQDRPWITIVPGPFHVGNTVAPYIALLKTLSTPLPFVSLDGLHYIGPVEPPLTTSGEAPSLTLPFNAARDWVQPIAMAFDTPLDRGWLIEQPGIGNPGDGQACNVATLDPQLVWACPSSLQTWNTDGMNHYLFDSWGQLHHFNLDDNGTRIQYSVARSPDPARHVTLAPPAGFKFLPQGNFPMLDYRVNAELDFAAGTFLVQSLTDSSLHHVLVYRITNITGQAVLRDTWQVGDDYHVVCEIPQACAQGVGEHSTRFDYCSLTILADGRIAVSYVDDNLDVPAVAIEM